MAVAHSSEEQEAEVLSFGERTGFELEKAPNRAQLRMMHEHAQVKDPGAVVVAHLREEQAGEAAVLSLGG